MGQPSSHAPPVLDSDPDSDSEPEVVDPELDPVSSATAVLEDSAPPLLPVPVPPPPVDGAVTVVVVGSVTEVDPDSDELDPAAGLTSSPQARIDIDPSTAPIRIKLALIRAS